MKKIIFVTFPKSGHHWLVRCLARYFEGYKYCEFYSHCKTIGCTSEVDAQKNHDFNLDLIIPEGFTPIVQYRLNLDNSIRSWYKAHAEGLPYDVFSRRKREFYKQWAEKWIGKHYEVIYENHQDDQIKTLENLIRYISGSCDSQRLLDTLEPNIK